MALIDRLSLPVSRGSAARRSQTWGSPSRSATRFALSAAIRFASRLADRIRRIPVMLLAAALLAGCAVGSGLAAQLVAGSPHLRSSLPYVLYAVFACLSLLVLRAGPETKRRERDGLQPQKPTVED